MDSGAILIPGGLRLRGLHPLLDRSGSCSLLYDLERNALVDVPEEFGYHIATALDTGDLDEDLLGWLAREDLLTYEGSPAWNGSGESFSELSELSLDSAGSPGLGCVYFLDHQAQCRLQRLSESAACETLDLLCRRSDGVSRIVVHLGSEEAELDFELLTWFVGEVERRAGTSGQEVAFELTVHGAVVTREMALFLRDHPFEVHLRCDGPPAPGRRSRRRAGFSEAVERGLALLLEHLPERVTVHAVLEAGAHLADLWRWAEETGLRRLQATKVAGSAGPFATHDAELRVFEQELAAVCEEMFLALEAGRPALLYEPVVRVVRQLASAGVPAGGDDGDADLGYLGVVANGKVFPFFRQLGGATEGAGLGGGPTVGVEASAVTGGSPCASCWARALCDRGSGCHAVEAAGGRVAPDEENCDFWRAEVEAALAFYRRLMDVDPTYCLGLMDGDESRFRRLSLVAPMVEWKTC